MLNVAKSTACNSRIFSTTAVFSHQQILNRWFSCISRPAVVNGAQESAEATRENLLCPAAHHAKEPSGRGRAGQGRTSQVTMKQFKQELTDLTQIDCCFIMWPLFLLCFCSWLAGSPRCRLCALSIQRSFRPSSSSTQRRLTCYFLPSIRSSSILTPLASCPNDRTRSQKHTSQSLSFNNRRALQRMNTVSQHPQILQPPQKKRNSRNVLHFKNPTRFHRYSHKNVYMRQQQKAPSVWPEMYRL